MAATTPNPKRGSQGFTLIEVMIALGIFAFGMVTLSSMQLHAMQGRSSGRHTTQAAAIAQTQMERLQQQAWASVAPTAGWAPAVTVANTVQSSPDRVEQAYTVDWRIADLVAGWTRTIDVRVQWDEPKRPGRSLVISGVRFNRDAV
ncbi:MAG: prepilin-type N-terminal cleavage/methylation domain-containing protein [Myxococcales bacterium]|nr:prepilin-type N-terminal cleavage/methylation domain-containing protein [Myxococcales bacterium]